MSVMTDKAIAHITEQMMASGDEMTRTLEEYLTSICNTDSVAEKLLQSEKSLEEFIKQLWSEAAKRQKNRQATMTSNEIIPMLEEYYNITEEDKLEATPTKKADVINIMDFL